QQPRGPADPRQPRGRRVVPPRLGSLRARFPPPPLPPEGGFLPPARPSRAEVPAALPCEGGFPGRSRGVHLRGAPGDLRVHDRSQDPRALGGAIMRRCPTSASSPTSTWTRSTRRSSCCDIPSCAASPS